MKIIGDFLHKNNIHCHIMMVPSKQQSTTLLEIVLSGENGWYNKDWGEVTFKRTIYRGGDAPGGTSAWGGIGPYLVPKTPNGNQKHKHNNHMSGQKEYGNGVTGMCQVNDQQPQFLCLEGRYCFAIFFTTFHFMETFERLNPRNNQPSFRQWNKAIKKSIAVG